MPDQIREALEELIRDAWNDVNHNQLARQAEQILALLDKPRETGWRVGTRNPLNVYEGDRSVCQCHTAEDAALIVAAMEWVAGNTGAGTISNENRR